MKQAFQVSRSDDAVLQGLDAMAVSMSYARDFCCSAHCGDEEEFFKYAPPEDVCQRMSDLKWKMSDLLEEDSEADFLDIDPQDAGVLLKELSRTLEKMSANDWRYDYFKVALCWLKGGV